MLHFYNFLKWVSRKFPSLIADGWEVYVQNDGVVDSNAHEHPDEVVMSLVTLLSKGKPVQPFGGVVHKHLVLRLRKHNMVLLLS